MHRRFGRGHEWAERVTAIAAILFVARSARVSKLTGVNREQSYPAKAASKPVDAVAQSKTGRRGRLSAEDFNLIPENQQLAGSSGCIAEETAAHEVDMETIAKSAGRFGAQIPSSKNRPMKPRITRFGSRPA
jgi:hypothetical protein